MNWNPSFSFKEVITVLRLIATILLIGFLLIALPSVLLLATVVALWVGLSKGTKK